LKKFKFFHSMGFCRSSKEGGRGRKVHPGAPPRPRDWASVPQRPAAFRALAARDPLFAAALVADPGVGGGARVAFWGLALGAWDCFFWFFFGFFLVF
jgi:hypothetical protein